MLLYLYTFRANQTHPDPFYRNRAKGGETDRKGELDASSSDDEIYERVLKRVKEQEGSALSEPPIILGYWFVETPPGVIEVDEAVREILITQYGGKVTRDDKNKTEWVIIPRDLESERIALYEQCIREYKGGCLQKRQMNEIDLHDVQNEIISSQVGNKTLHIAGCASGKTYVELHDFESNVPSSEQVNVLCTSGIELANQIARDFTYNTTMNQSFGSREIIIVHSGKSGLPGNEASINIEDIVYQIKNTTNPIWLIVVYNSVRTAARAVAFAGRSVYMKVLDEVHRTAGIGNTVYRDAILLKCEKQRGYSASYRTVHCKKEGK